MFEGEMAETTETTEPETQEAVAGVDEPADPNNPGDEAVLTFGALSVPPGPFEITGTTKRNMRAQCMVIPKQQGALIDVSKIEIGDETFTLGSTTNANAAGVALGSSNGTPGTDFAEYGQCSNVVANACIKTGESVTISGINKSLVATDIQVSFRGTKLSKGDCPAPRGPNAR